MKINMPMSSRNLSIFLALVLMLMSCQQNSGYGELTGVMDRNRSSAPVPYGMAYVPGGYFTMGAGGDDPTYSQTYNPKSVSISSFFMDDTEITNNEYRQFIQWVFDSLSRRLLGEIDETFLIESENEDAPPSINWKTRIRPSPEVTEALEPLYIPIEERFYHRKEVDTRKLNFEYYWYDYESAARKQWGEVEADPRTEGVNMASFVNRPQSLRSRSGYVRKEVINVYPDTLCWMVDFSYAYNDPFVRSYFNSAQYDHYPVVGVNWHQAQAFCVWRTTYYNSNAKNGSIDQFRLPTEAEWEFAARGGLDLNPYPWGGPYATNKSGCFIGNFKPQRGKYALDGASRPSIVGHYAPNDYGLYDMMGNVAEWCEDAYSESYDALHDIDPVYKYDAKPDDAQAKKRKVIRGGSFKDFAELTKVYARTYEYQDTCKSYVGFRCVMSALGGESGSNVYR